MEAIKIVPTNFSGTSSYYLAVEIPNNPRFNKRRFETVYRVTGENIQPYRGVEFLSTELAFFEPLGYDLTQLKPENKLFRPSLGLQRLCPGDCVEFTRPVYGEYDGLYIVDRIEKGVNIIHLNCVCIA